MTEYLIKDFKGHSIGYNYDENTDTYTWFTIEPPKHGEDPIKVTFGGEWAAQAARTRFLDNINDMFNRYFKREFARLDIDPATGRRNPCGVAILAVSHRILPLSLWEVTDVQNNGRTQVS